MRRVLSLAVAAALLFSAATAWAMMPSALLDFEDGTDEGFGTGFGNDASMVFPIDNIAGSLRMRITDTSAFQQAGRETSNPTEDVYQVLLAASADETRYFWSYDWYVDTSSPNDGTFLQISTYINTGNGYYAQDWDWTPLAKDVELNGDQLASGQVFSGTSVESFAAKNYDIPAGQTFFRPGFITNGNGTGVNVYIDNIRFYCIPEPATIALVGLVIPALLVGRRRS